jgi:transposase
MLSSTSLDSQGFWLAQKRLSRGRFRWWPTSAAAAATLEAHQLQRLIMGGDPAARDAAPVWRRIRTG